MRLRVRPYPEALKTGVRWDVSRGRPRTNITTRQMWVLDDNSKAARFGRLHELAHAKWTTREQTTRRSRRVGVPFEVIDAAEDIRLHHKLKANGFEQVGEGFLTDLEAAAYVIAPGQELIYLSTYGSGDWAKLQGAINSAVEPVRTRMRSLEALAAAALENRDHAKLTSAWTDRLAQAIWALLDARTPEESAGVLSTELADFTRDGSDGRVQSGVMTIERPEMVRRLVRSSPKVRASETGVKIGLLSRMLTDFKVFREKLSQKAKSDTHILVDCSGSMSMTDAQLQGLVKAFPLGSIAYYAGAEDDDYRGILRIVAKDGWTIKETGKDGLGNGNVVDLPALAWLSSQKGRRIWISDGEVTGTGDRQEHWMMDAAERICKHGDIERFEDIGEFTATLRKFV